MKATPKLPRNCAFAVCAAALLASGAALAQMPFAPFGGRSAALALGVSVTARVGL